MEIHSVVSLLIWLVVIGLIFGIVWWVLGVLALPAPFDKVARVLVAVVAALLLINMLLGMIGGAPVIRFR